MKVGLISMKRALVILLVGFSSAGHCWQEKWGKEHFPHLQVKDLGVIINWREQIKTVDDHWVTYVF